MNWQGFVRALLHEYAFRGINQIGYGEIKQEQVVDGTHSSPCFNLPIKNLVILQLSSYAIAKTHHQLINLPSKEKKQVDEN